MKEHTDQIGKVLDNAKGGSGKKGLENLAIAISNAME